MLRRTSAMVEAGILAAVAIVMALISMYVPVLGAFINFLWPLPIVICGCRHGLKWSIMTLIVAGIIIAMVLSPVTAFFLAAIFGLLGIVLGECLRRHLPPAKIMLYGTIGGIVALVLNIVLSFLVLGIDPIEMMFTSFNDSLGQLETYYREHGMSDADIKQAIDGYAEMFRMMRIIMPGAFLLLAPVMAFVNYYTAKKILKRLGETFEDLPSLMRLQLPVWLVWPFLLSLVAVTYFYKTDQSSWMYTFSVNVQTVCSFLFIFQGIILLYWYVAKKGKPRWWANVAVIVIFAVPLISQIMVYIGAFDSIADFRKLRPRNRK